MNFVPNCKIIKTNINVAFDSNVDSSSQNNNPTLVYAAISAIQFSNCKKEQSLVYDRINLVKPSHLLIYSSNSYTPPFTPTKESVQNVLSRYIIKWLPVSPVTCFFVYNLQSCPDNRIYLTIFEPDIHFAYACHKLLLSATIIKVDLVDLENMLEFSPILSSTNQSTRLYQSPARTQQPSITIVLLYRYKS